MTNRVIKEAFNVFVTQCNKYFHKDYNHIKSKKNLNLKIQLVPLHQHRENRAERAIQT